MFFKKKELNKFSYSKYISNIIWLLAIFIIFLLWIFIINIVNNINFHLLDFAIWKNSFISDISPNNKQNDKINILIIWRWWWNHDAPNLTDTIILGSINTKKNTISMLSIPRDLYVEYPNSKNYPNIIRKWKINKIYELFLWEWEDLAISKLGEKITEITGENIDYYVNIDFNWFKEIVDTLWWVEVTVPKNFVDYKYPDGKWWYTTFILKKWTWILDWEVALKYARSRHSTSDFSRSLRQQQIIKALKKRIFELWYLKDSSKIKDLFLSLEKNIKTNIDLQSLIKIWLFLKDNQINLLSFNLNDSCFFWNNDCHMWWFLYVPLREYFNNQSVLLPNWADINNINNYDWLKMYMDIIFNQTEIFKENYQINIYNAAWVKFLASNLADELTKYWFNIPKTNSIWNIKDKKFIKSIIYYNNIKDDSYTIKVLKEMLNADFIQVNKPLYSEDNTTKIEIIIWDDYKKILKNNNNFY